MDHRRTEEERGDPREIPWTGRSMEDHHLGDDHPEDDDDDDHLRISHVNRQDLPG